MATSLSDKTLTDVQDGGVAVPAYDRGALRVGIVHIGVGGFHRAHQAMYLDRLMNQGKALDWAICGVGVLPADSRMRDALRAQDGLFTLVEKGTDGTYRARVIGSIADYLLAPDDPERVVETMADPAVRIVSLTITEGGYNLNARGAFVADAAAVVHDLTSGQPPRTAFGLVIEALVRRRERGLAPFTVLSCDNMEGNGHAARVSFSSYASLRSPELGDWVHDQVHFPNSMVDRITPVTTDEDRAEVADRFGVADRWPVVSETFSQWVLEDAFGPGGRPPWEAADVQLVPDVEPYEMMKLRLLNAGHAAVSFLGYLAGYRFVHDACRDPLFADFLLGYMEHEATPTLDPVPGIDLPAYRHQLLERFSNAGVRDTLARLCADSSDKIPKFLLPVVRHNLPNGEVRRSATVLAAWARYCEAVDEQGAAIPVVDRLAERLTASAREQARDPIAFLRDRELFGDLVDDQRFAGEYRRALDALHADGARATLQGLQS